MKHRGDLRTWIATLENRLQDAKTIERRAAKHLKAIEEIARKMGLK